MRVRTDSILTLFAIASPAVSTNYFIDDSDPNVQKECRLCTRATGFSKTKLYNRTVTEALGSATENAQVSFNFTGNAVYVYLMVAAAKDAFGGKSPTPPYQCTFSLDGNILANQQFVLPPPPEASDYNHLAFFANTSMAYGPHSVVLQSVGASGFYFDYAMYSADDDLTSSSANQSPTSTTASSTATPVSFKHGKKKSSVGAIVGAAIGGTAVTILALVGFFLFRRRTRLRTPEKQESIWAGEETEPTSPAVLESQMRLLQEQVQRLEQREEVRSSTSTDVASSRLGPSTMKRAQTRVVAQEEHRGRSWRHTDSGLQLTAEIVEDNDGGVEMPPLYVAD
ncbi:hypothetical protein DFH06DRAFT_1206878 [Mycena polygramma]|nr:hypothetical protein DFH06DRAFT_1206878 [Mycena polygramma]